MPTTADLDVSDKHGREPEAGLAARLAAAEARCAELHEALSRQIGLMPCWTGLESRVRHAEARADRYEAALREIGYEWVGFQWHSECGSHVEVDQRCAACIARAALAGGERE